MKELTILGRGPSWKLCPFEGEIWATSTVLITDEMKDKRYDKVFAFDLIKDENIRKAADIAKERGIPLVSTRKGYRTECYPSWEVVNEFGISYLKNTVSYMLALAIYKGYDQINLYGCDQTDDRKDGKSFVIFWLGVATGRGIKFIIPSVGMPFPTPESFKERMKEKENAKRKHCHLCFKYLGNT